MTEEEEEENLLTTRSLWRSRWRVSDITEEEEEDLLTTTTSTRRFALYDRGPPSNNVRQPITGAAAAGCDNVITTATGVEKVP